MRRRLRSLLAIVVALLALLVLGLVVQRVSTAERASLRNPRGGVALSPAGPEVTPQLQPAAFLPLFLRLHPATGIITGTVFDESGPLAGATVRIQATRNSTLTDQEGRFVLAGLVEGVPLTVSAWKQDYYCAKVEGVVPTASCIRLSLHRYQEGDNPDYVWIPPAGSATSCASCKAGMTQVWLDNDAHAASSTNPRFLTMYNGTDVNGNQSPLTRYVCSPDYGCFPLPPDPAEPYYGPGYKLDFPNTAGNCAACHTPGAAVDVPYGIDPNAVSGADTFGVHCDLCHKVADVQLNPSSGLPYDNMPGVLSMDIRRPFTDDPERHQLFFGTFDDDNEPAEDTYLPLIEESQFCAPCHYGTFWGTIVYNSFGEWLDSPYSDASFAGAQTCQDCHMPAPTLLEGEAITNVAPGKGGVERDPLSIHAHTFPGAASEELLRNAVALTATTALGPGDVTVRVDITNDQTGHHVPTDSPLRHLILLVEATDEIGSPLSQLDGSTVPEWGGLGDPAEGYYAGLPGKAFAKVLEDRWIEESPSGAYWNPTRILSDNRIAAFATDASTYTFAAPDEGGVAVEVKLLFRRAFIELMEQKGWDVPDIVMEEASITVPAQP